MQDVRLRPDRKMQIAMGFHPDHIIQGRVEAQVKSSLAPFKPALLGEVVSHSESLSHPRCNHACDALQEGQPKLGPSRFMSCSGILGKPTKT